MWLLVSIICIYWIHVAVYMWLLYCLCSGMGRNHQPGHTQCPGAKRPWSCQATGKHPQDKCPSLQSSGPSLCCTAGPHLFGHAQRLQGESLFRTSKFLHILHVLVIHAMFCVFICSFCIIALKNQQNHGITFSFYCCKADLQPLAV